MSRTKIVGISNYSQTSVFEVLLILSLSPIKEGCKTIPFPRLDGLKRGCPPIELFVSCVFCGSIYKDY